MSRSSHSRESSFMRPEHTMPSASSMDPGENLLLPDGPVSEESAQLIHELVHQHDREDTLVPDADDDECDDEEQEYRKRLPWWKKPSPMWLLSMLPVVSIAMSATIAPRVEIYTALACAQVKPEILHNQTELIPNPLLDTNIFYSNISNPTLFHTASQDFAGELPGGADPPKKRPTNPCASDPTVQAAVAQLAVVMTACMGVLSVLSTGWWSSFSDRHGRTTVLGISVIGLLLTDANFILVYYNFQSLPGGYWFLVLGPLIEGSLGGFTSAMAAFHAYLADTTTSATRSRTFSMTLGLLFAGFAIGPTLGGLLIRATQKTISVFYVASAVHFMYAFLVWTVLPESLGKRKRQLNLAKYRDELVDSRRAREGGGFFLRLRRLFSFLSPLSVFHPKLVSVSGNPLKTRRDWNLTLIALAYAFTISIMGSVTYKFQYAASTFSWSSETLGYWLSLVGAARAFHLAVILPICIRLFKRKPAKSEASSETEPLLSSSSSSAPSTSSASSATATASDLRSDSPSRLKEPHSSAFDLGLARASLAVEFIAYGFMGAVTHPIAFTLFGMLGAFGTGFSPAIQSVALELYTQQGGTEIGRLFGALSVIQALSSQIIGPALYGVVYMRTVAVFPRTIFFVSVASVFLSLVFLSLVRLPRKRGHDNAGNTAEAEHGRDATLVDVEVEVETESGRKPNYTDDESNI